MLQMSYCLRSLGDIESCIRLFAASYVPGKQSILIFIYTHWNTPEAIHEMIRLFCAAFPEAEIAGMTTAGGIDNGRMRLRQTVVTIQFFEKSDVHTAIYDFSKEPMKKLGEKALSFCQKETNLSAVLLFMTQRYYDFEPFLTALDKLGRDIPICGGYAHTYRNEDGIYVFTKDAILSRGILLVTFSGDVKVMTTSVMGWQPLGRTMTITAIDGPLVIRSLDHKPAAYFIRNIFTARISGKANCSSLSSEAGIRSSSPFSRSNHEATVRFRQMFSATSAIRCRWLTVTPIRSSSPAAKHLAISSALPPKGCSSSPVSRGVTS